MTIFRFAFAALIVLFSGPISGNDWSAPPPLASAESASLQVGSGDGSDPNAQSGLHAPGAWRTAPPVSRHQPTSRTADLPLSLTISWPALDQAAIDAARKETSSRALITGLHRAIPSGYQGNLLEDLSWTLSGSHRRARIQLSADGAASIRVRFRASLPADGSLTFLGTHSGAAGFPPVWSQSLLASRNADSVAIWSPSSQGSELGMVVAVPANAELTGHFLVFEALSHRWASASGSTFTTAMSPKHGPSLDCPSHYRDAACYPLEYPNTEGAVVHIHYESGAGSYLCSGTMLSQRGVSGNQLRDLLLTAHHCIGTREEADSIESVHYLMASRCGGLSLHDRVFWTYGGADYLEGLHSADQTLVELRGPFRSNYWLSGWNASNDAPPPGAVFGLHHPSGAWMAFSKGLAYERRDVFVRDYGTVLGALPVLYSIGTTEGGSSGSGLFYDSTKAYLVGVLSAGLGCDDPSAYGSFRDFFPVIRRHIDPGGTEDPVKLVGRMPFFPRDRLPSQQGFALVINSSDREARVVVRASDDTSTSFAQACSFRVPTRATRAFNSRDLEVGNASKGCTGVGRGSGDWTLQVWSDVPTLRLHVYARALDASGFANSLAGTAREIESEGEYRYHLPIVNPASNLLARSKVRITNLGPARARNVRIIGFDSQGRRFPAIGTTYLARSLAPNQTTSFTSQDLEYGNPDKLRGAVFGDGAGKWNLWLYSPEARLEVTGLMISQGLTSNLSR